MVVDLPAPFGPTNPVTRPAATGKLRSSTARRSPYFLVRFETVIIGGRSWRDGRLEGMDEPAQSTATQSTATQSTATPTLPRACPCSTWCRPDATSARANVRSTTGVS
jgi:hypothetical protein